MVSRRQGPLVFLCAAILTGAPALAADAPDGSGQPKDIYAVDLESLLNMKVITVSKFSEKLSDAPGVITVVTRDELRRFGGLTLSEILDRVPGLAISGASFTDRSIVAVRGDQTKINGGHVLYLINGRPTREILEGGLIGDFLESFPVNILEKIEVIRGPGSVLYGSNAFSGVVNLITQKPDHDEFVATGLGARGNGVATSGQATVRSGNLGIVAAAQFHQEPTWFTPIWTTYGGRESGAIPDRGTGAYLGLNYKGLSVMSSFTELTTAYIEGLVGIARWRRGFADLGYSLKAAQNWDMSFNLTYTRATMNAVKSIPFITRDSQDLVLEWTNVVHLSDRSRVTFGALYNYIRGREDFFGTSPGMTISVGSRPGEAFYAQVDHQVSDRVKLIGGFQANKIGDIKLDVVPRAGVIWSPASHFSLKTLYSEAFRAPSLNETLLHYVPPPSIGGPSLLGNPNLLPEKVATADIALSYQGNRAQAEIGYFHSRQTADIVQTNVTTAGLYVNLGEATFHGVELEGKYYFQKNFFLTASALYQANEDGDGNRNVTPLANYGAKGGFSYESANGFTLGIFDVFQGPVHGYSAALNPMPGAYSLLNGHLRFDLSKLLHSAAWNGVALVAHADNLANTPVWLPDWKDNPGDSIFANRGRTVYIGFEFALRKD